MRKALGNARALLSAISKGAPDVAKHLSAIGSSSVEDRFRDPSISKEDAVETVLDILAAKTRQNTNVLTDEEYSVLSLCLDSVGSEEVSLADDGSIQGRSVISYTVEKNGIEAEISSDFAVRNVWDRTRREWACTMGLRKLRGDARATKMDFEFMFASFGFSDAGEPIVLFDFSYERSVDAPSQLQGFNKGGQLKVSEYDITSNVQWGYLIVANCRMFFEDGTVLTA